VNSNTSNISAFGKTIARNTVFNIVGQGFPTLAAVVSIPILIKYIGADRFGILTLAWMVIGYFSLFDFGIGRALTKLVAEKLGSCQKDELSELIWTALLVMLILGSFGGLLSAALTSVLVSSVLKVPEYLLKETSQSFYILSSAIPIVILTTGLRGVLEAQQRFDLVNMVRIPMGLFTFLAPLLIIPFSTSLTPIIILLVSGRLIFCIVHYYLCLRVDRDLFKNISFNIKLVSPLLSFGSWITITNIVGPMMVYLDRFVIGSLLSVSNVAYYATPYEMITKLLLVPSALVGVLFPVFSTGFVQDPQNITRVYYNSVKYIYLLLFPIILIVITFSYEILDLWVGHEFAIHSYRILQWLALGVLLNSIALIPFTFIQGIGRPDITSKFHLIELPLYILVLRYLLLTVGVDGAAIAWVGRVLLDAVLLFIATSRLIKLNKHLVEYSIAMAGSVCVSIALALLTSIFYKILFSTSIILSFLVITWIVLLDDSEKSFLKGKLNVIKCF